MPKKEQTITIQNFDTDTALAIAYEAFKNLNWRPLFAGGDKLLGNTVKKITTNPQQIIIGIAGSELSISSEMIHSELMDITHKNKKNIQAFITAFEALQNTITESVIEANKQAINTLRIETERAAGEDTRQNAEVDTVMKLSTSNLYVTYGIIVINVLVFIAMSVSGVSLFSPTTIDIIKWGGNIGPLTTSGDWWRLITNTFEHIGIIHIVFNMYVLYMVGIYLEPMLGKIRYTVAYLCTGIIASLVSLWWHSSNPTTSAGASGAIFGMYGVFLALLSTNLIPKKVRAALLQNIGIFVVYNLVFGIKSGVDNSAHTGGLISGFIIGYAYYFTLKKEFSLKPIAVVSAIIIAATAGSAYLCLQNVKPADTADVKLLRNELEDARYADDEKYKTGMQKFADLEDEAIKPLNDATGQTDEQLADRLNVESEPKWQEAATIINQLKGYDVSAHSKKKAELVSNYIQLRLTEIDDIRKIAKGENSSVTQLNTTREKLQAVLDALKNL